VRTQEPVGQDEGGLGMGSRHAEQRQ